MNWNKKEIDNETVREVSNRFSIDLLTASIFVRRGITSPEKIKFFLETDIRYLHNPFLFDEMEDAVDRILQAEEEGEKVKIVGDRDVDGITSTVMLYNELRGLSIDAEWSLPLGDEPYGLTMKSVEDFAAQDGSLIITVDCGISNVREIGHAAQLGIDTIILDHHNPQDERPLAAAIINPKIPDCGYPFRDLAGCGVTAKMIWALRFAKTELYKGDVVFLHARPGNETVIIETVLMVNMVEVDRITENLIPGMVRLEQTRLAPVLRGKMIVVYDEETQKKMLRKVFPEIEFGDLIDLAPKIGTLFPVLAGKSVLKLKEKSRSTRYLQNEQGEIDIVIALFTIYLHKMYPSLSTEYEEIFDMVALGTVADMMPLIDENRIFVKKGLLQLSSAKRPAVKDLLAQQNLLGKRLTTFDIGWQISPAINSTGRLGVPDKAVELFLTEDPELRRSLAEEIAGLNKERKKLGETAWSALVPLARSSHKELNEKMIFVADKSVHRGITGILAARLVNQFNAPAMVVAYLENNLVGSMRSIKGFNVKDFLANFEDLFIDYGGHDYAAGFSLKEEVLPVFVDRLHNIVSRLEIIPDIEESLDIDAELPPEYMNPDLNELVERFEPFGEECSALLFLARGMKVVELDLMGKGGQNHVKMLLDSGKFKWPAVFWNASDRVGHDFSLGDCIDIIFKLGKNYFQSNETLQLTIVDLKNEKR